jgi:predicted anti-sigma-YlaC factor YlaD
MSDLKNGRKEPVREPTKRPAMIGILLFALIWTGSCSLEKMAMKKVAGMLSSSSSGTVFTGDNDPELVGDALPFALKLQESILASIPNHDGLRLSTGSLYVMYANAFVQTPADMTPRQEIEKKEALLQRAKNLYFRGRDILLVALKRKNPALLELLKARKYEEALAPYGPKDIPFLYWAAVGWVGGFAADPFDMKQLTALPEAGALMERVVELDPGYGQGAIDVFYIMYYGSLPQYMGGDLGKARAHFEKAMTTAGEGDTSPLLAMATSVCVKEQKADEFKALLDKILEVDVDKYPDNRLVNTLNQRKARWLIEHIDDYFLILEERPGALAKEGPS